MPFERVPELLSRLARLIAADGYYQGLQPVQWQALRYLAAANRFSRTPGGLTAWLGQTKGSVSQTINTLIRKGLLSRNGDESDRRVVRLALTADGEALVQDHKPVAADILNALSEKERAIFGDLAEKCLRANLAVRGRRPFGVCRECRHFERSGGDVHRCKLLNVSLSTADSNLICVEQEAA